MYRLLNCLSIVFQASHSHIPFFCSHGFIGRDELGGLDECVSLLIINVALTLASGVASFSVGHAEKVISTDFAVGSQSVQDYFHFKIALVGPQKQ